MADRGKNLLLTAATVFLTLALCEVGLRLWHGVSLLNFSNFSSNRPIQFNLSGAVRYDPVLGWSLKDDVDDPDFHTLEYGIRRNNVGQTGLRPGNILAVGSSFTAGTEVADEQTWPAQLERLTGRPVDNAAVPAFALDQFVLRAEQLLPVARPRVLLIGLGERAIEWIGYSAWRAPKPFFTVERGTLVAHNIPVLLPAPNVDPFEPVKAILGHSHLVHRLMSRLYPDVWHSNARDMYRVRNNPVDVSCRLLQRLKQKTDKLEIRAVIVSEIWSEEIMAADAAPAKLRLVEQCAQGMGYQLADTFGLFRAIHKAEPKRLDEYYVFTNSRPVHFSELGNRRVAEIVAVTLAVEPTLAGGR